LLPSWFQPAAGSQENDGIVLPHPIA